MIDQHTRTSSYRFTIHSLSDPRLAELRKEVAERNRQVPWSEPQEVSWSATPVRVRTIERVSVKARLGKDNPNREKYRTRSGVLNTQHVRLEDGAYFDVYVHLSFTEKGFTSHYVPPAVDTFLERAQASVVDSLDEIVDSFGSWTAGMTPKEVLTFTRFTTKRLAQAITSILS